MVAAVCMHEHDYLYSCNFNIVRIYTDTPSCVSATAHRTCKHCARANCLNPSFAQGLGTSTQAMSGRSAETPPPGSAQWNLSTLRSTPASGKCSLLAYVSSSQDSTSSPWPCLTRACRAHLHPALANRRRCCCCGCCPPPGICAAAALAFLYE